MYWISLDSLDRWLAEDAVYEGVLRHTSAKLVNTARLDVKLAWCARGCVDFSVGPRDRLAMWKSRAW